MEQIIITKEMILGNNEEFLELVKEYMDYSYRNDELYFDVEVVIKQELLDDLYQNHGIDVCGISDILISGKIYTGHDEFGRDEREHEVELVLDYSDANQTIFDVERV